jgi:SlyX protein
MDSSHDVNRRLTDLEIKVSFTEDLLEQLDQVVIRQQQQIELLLREVAQLRQPVADGDVRTTHSLRDELPPHF